MRGKAFRREQVKKFQKSRAKYWTRFWSNTELGEDWRRNVRDVRWFAGLGKHKMEYSRKDIGRRLDHKKLLRDLDRWFEKLMLQEALNFNEDCDIAA